MAEQRHSRVGATGSRDRATASILHTTDQSTHVPGRMCLSGESGFTSNQRLVLGYRPTLDLADNPQYGLLLSDNYISQTKRHYQPYSYYDGSGSLPGLFNKFRESGFFQLDAPPKPLSQDEKTEYQSLFLTHPLVPTVPPHKIIAVGQKENSGFTERTDLQINTFMDKACPHLEPRCTHNSVTKTDFLAPCHLQGSEHIPNIRSHACRETGYTRGATALLKNPSSLLPSPWKTLFPNHLKTTGKKEPSGFLHNAPNHRTYPLTPLHSSHFVTHYDNVFGPDSGLRPTWSSTGAGIIPNKTSTGYNRRDTDKFIYRDSTFTV